MEFNIESISDSVLEQTVKALHFEERLCQRQIELFQKRRQKALAELMEIEAERERRKRDISASGGGAA